MALEDEISEPEGEPNDTRIQFRLGSVLSRINDGLSKRRIATMDPATVTTRAQIKNRLRLIIKIILKNEIQNDPAARGYAGKTNAEIAALLNDPYVTVTQIPDGRGGFVNINISQTPRVCLLLDKIPHAPNFIRPELIPEILA